MKLASYRDGSRDGQLVVVSRDLASAHYATGIAGRLQQVLDDWNFMSPQLQHVYDTLNQGKLRHAFPFDPAQCMAPLPRAFQWVDSAGPVADDGTPTLRRGASDAFLSPYGEIACAAPLAIDIEVRVAVAVGDVEAGIAPGSAIERVRLVLLAAEVVDRGAPDGFASAFAPVALTPDELGVGWQGGRLSVAPDLYWNGKRSVRPPADPGQRPPFGTLIAVAAARRGLAAGSLVGSGPMASAEDGPAARTLQPGDRVRVDLKGADGQAQFGSIELRGVGPAVDLPDSDEDDTPV